LKDLRITNPDAPQTDSHIILKKSGTTVGCTMILYSKSRYKGGNFFQYLQVGFLKLKGSETKAIDYVEGNPVIYSFDDVSGFFEQVGKNTNYFIHPEEIMADNFALALENKSGMPSQTIIEKIQSKLRM
jgi:hypothetical protein